MDDKVTDENNYDFNGGHHQRSQGRWFRLIDNRIVDSDQYRHDLESRNLRQAQEAPKADKEIDDLDCANCPDQGTSACLRCDGVGQDPKAASQSADKSITAENLAILLKLDSKKIAIRRIESDRAAQLQAGREEVGRDLIEARKAFHRLGIARDEEAKRYAAVVEAARGMKLCLAETMLEKRCGGCDHYRLCKALSDLNAKPDAGKGE